VKSVRKGKKRRPMLQTNGPGNECSRERIVLGTNIPDTDCTMHPHRPGRFLYITCNHCSQELSCDYLYALCASRISAEESLRKVNDVHLVYFGGTTPSLCVFYGPLQWQIAPINNLSVITVRSRIYR